MTTKRSGGFSIDPFRVLQLLDRIDAPERGATVAPSRRGRSPRRQPRYFYRQALINLDALHPGGTASQLSIYSRNISAGGLAFVHSGFLHPGTRCDFSLPRLDGLKQQIYGRIVNCRHLDGVMHELSVKFDSDIDAGCFVLEARDDQGELQASTEQLEREVRWAADEVDRALNPPNLARAIVICSRIEALAEELRYARLSETARIALIILRRASSVAASAHVLREVRQLCHNFSIQLT